MDSIHRENIPFHNDSFTVKVILAMIWAKAKIEINDQTPFATIRKFLCPLMDISVPQQTNSNDCGIYMLLFVEVLLQAAPDKSIIQHQYSNAFPTGVNTLELRRLHHRLIWEAHRRLEQQNRLGHKTNPKEHKSN